MKRKLQLSILILMAISCFASEIRPPKRGYFQDDSANKCWYKTIIQNNSKHFCDVEGEKVYTHIIEKNNCLPNNNVSKMMIANVVTRFYKGTKFQRDTKFQSDPSLWKKAKQFQKQGLSIKATNYSFPSVWIDFILSTDKKHILKVMHCAGI
jgi:hypothetical protein